MLYRHRFYTVDEDSRLFRNRKKRFSATPSPNKQLNVKLPFIKRAGLSPNILGEGIKNATADHDKVRMNLSLEFNLTLINSFDAQEVNLFRKNAESCEPRFNGNFRKEIITKGFPTEAYSKKGEIESPTRIVSIKNTEVQEFIESIFSLKANKYRRNPKTQVTNMDLNQAEALLKEAKLIAKIGVSLKKSKKYISEIRDHWEIDHFWYKYIGDKIVRWDQFEENFLSYIETFMIIDSGFIRKIHWEVLIDLLYENLAQVSEHYKLWPKGPTCQDPPCYQGKIVDIDAWTELVYRSELKELIIASIQNSTFYISQLHKGKTYTYKCGSVYRGEWQKNVREGQGSLKLSSTEEYSGNFSKGRRSGFGTMKAMNYSYTGEWENDKMHGYGKLVYPDGIIFQGKFENNQPVNGTYNLANEARYTGNVRDGFYDSDGVLEAEGKICKGKWKLGKMHGKGEVNYSGGKIISGNFENGEMHTGKLITCEYNYNGEFRDLEPNGTGVLKHIDGSIISGKFHHGKINGFGTLRHVNGDLYEGDFEDGRKNGIGKMIYTDGRIYEGSWINNKISGQGTLSFPPSNKEVRYIGYFEDGIYDGDGRMEYADDSFYDGHWLSGVKSGEGVWKTSSSIYIGGFRSNRIHGYGKLNFTNNSYYYGMFDYGIPQGKGEAMDTNGATYDGIFNRGQPIKKSGFTKGFIESLNKEFDV
jgi:hypothetical protein